MQATALWSVTTAVPKQASTEETGTRNSQGFAVRHPSCCAKEGDRLSVMHWGQQLLGLPSSLEQQCGDRGQNEHTSFRL